MTAERRPPRARRPRSITARVTWGAVLVVALALVAGSAAGVAILARSLTDGVAVALDGDLDTIGERIEDGVFDVQDAGDDLLVRLRSGDTVAVDDDEAGAAPEVAEDETRRVIVDGDAYLAASSNTDAGVLTVARPVDHVDEAVVSAMGLLAVAVPLALVVIGLVVWERRAPRARTGRVAPAPGRRDRRRGPRPPPGRRGAGDELDRLAER